MGPRIRLITRGDDCGGTHTANRAILDACRQGILKNVSVMVTCPAIHEAAELFALEKNLCLGLHANINAEWDNVRWGPILPAEQVPSLLDDEGYFYRTPKHILDREVRVEEIMAELKAQLAVARKLGFDIRYVDQHMRFGWISHELDAEFEAWCAEEGLLCENHFQERLPQVEGVDHLDPVERLITQLDRADAGQYVVVAHPGYDTEEMRALGHEGFPGSKVAYDRNWERLYFMDPRVIDYCRNHEVEPIRYDEATPVK